MDARPDVMSRAGSRGTGDAVGPGGVSRLEGMLVCVVSGRPLADVRRQVGISSLVYSGNHGLEIDGESLRFVHPEAGRGRVAIGA